MPEPFQTLQKDSRPNVNALQSFAEFTVFLKVIGSERSSERSC
jgi:hypothetical protein